MKFPDILIRKPLPPQAELMEFPDIPTGNSPRRQLQGPRPTPLTISKDSLKIRKPLLPQAELMEFPDIPTGKSPRRQLLGPRPSPIRIQKDSQKIRKPPPPPLQPFIIYSVSPKVIHNPLSDYMSLDQYLTGSSSSASSFNMGSKDSFSCNQGDMVSPAARFAAIEKARSPQPKKVLVQHQSGEAGGDREGIVEVGDAVDGPNSTSHGILSPGPAALSPIPASFFSPPATADPSTQQTTPDHLLTDDRGAIENFRVLLERSIFTQDHTNDKYVHSKEDGHAILHSVNTLSPLFMKKSGLGLTDPPKDEAWHSVVHMELANNKLSELPLSPSSPELRVLMLQGNANLTRVPNTFFSKMPLLTVLDLSHTSLRELPDSIFELEQLREMYLKGCERFMKLSPKIAKLKNIEKLDLDGTQIIHLPEEIQELTNLQSLFLCFYEYPGRKGKQYTRSTIIPSDVISKLKWLKRLSIDVNPDDERWYENVRDIIPEIFGLEHLQTLSLYIPHLELLKFIPDRILLGDFRLIVGRHMQRIISSTPSTIEAKFKQCGSSLKFVNGEDVPDEIKRLVRFSKALFLERHKTIKHLSEFKMMNLEQLRVCMLAECREMQSIVNGRQSNRGNEIFSHLLYLYVSHMKSLKSIWEGVMPPRSFFGMLRSLVLQNCPELTTVFTMDFLGNLSLLKELIVQGCPKVTTLISDGSFRLGIFLPKMSKIMLLHLPELVTISNGCHIAPSLNGMAVYDCPKLQSLSKSELSSSTVKVIKGEIKWWDQLQWSKEEWGTSQRPTKFDRIFSSIDNQVDIMTQIGNAGDDIDDDADMAPPHTLFEDPKQNADSFSCSAKKNAERFTFRTKSEVDVLDDGYKWRKYGVKTASSEYPRSYYRCTRAGCLVRKRVQRSTGDPTMIETVYEGIHTHPSPEENRSLHELQSMRSEEISSDRVVTARGLDVNSAPADVDDADHAAALSSPNSEISSFHMDFPVRNSHGSGGYKREHDDNADRPSDDDENGSTRKKLRLSKEQSAFLEESFKEHTTLNPKQELALAKKLNLRPRQVEVWFQNRLARTKLKQREVDCEYLKRCCDTLAEENRRLQKEVQELRALKTSQPYYMQLPATALTMCPSSERVVTKSSAAGTTSTATATATCTSGASRIPVALSLGNGMLPFAKAQAQAHHTSS